jgi:D-alanine-D-alanine ligase
MRVLVITGGSSSERDVAIASARQVVAALRSRGHTVTVVDTISGVLDEAAEQALLAARVGVEWPDTRALEIREREFLLGAMVDSPALRSADVVFLALHGGRGEDGTIQHILEVAGIPYTGSGPLGSGIALDKDVSKRLFRQAGVPTADWLMHLPGAPVSATEVDHTLGWPVVVKPSREGSTVGLTVVRDPAHLGAALEEAARYDPEVMVERFIPGRELTIGILGSDALAVGEIIPRHELFDYECKYTPGMSEEIFPASLPPEVTAEVQRLGLAAHLALKLKGYSRVDFRLTPEGRLYCLEVNTLPGMTSTSLMPQSAGAMGIGFPELCEKICELGQQ